MSEVQTIDGGDVQPAQAVVNRSLQENMVPPARDPADDSDLVGPPPEAPAAEAPAAVEESATAEPQAAAPDIRPAWVCVLPEGPRTVSPSGTPHPIFNDDSHLMGMHVRCPVCGSTSVRPALPNELVAPA